MQAAVPTRARQTPHSPRRSRRTHTSTSSARRRAGCRAGWVSCTARCPTAAAGTPHGPCPPGPRSTRRCCSCCRCPASSVTARRPRHRETVSLGSAARAPATPPHAGVRQPVPASSTTNQSPVFFTFCAYLLSLAMLFSPSIAESRLEGGGTALLQASTVRPRPTATPRPICMLTALLALHVMLHHARVFCLREGMLHHERSWHWRLYQRMRVQQPQRQRFHAESDSGSHNTVPRWGSGICPAPPPYSMLHCCFTAAARRFLLRLPPSRCTPHDAHVQRLKLPASHARALPKMQICSNSRPASNRSMPRTRTSIHVDQRSGICMHARNSCAVARPMHDQVTWRLCELEHSILA